MSEITSRDLHQHLNYPYQIREMPEALNAISLNNAVWDIEHRTLLKLGEGKIVVQANRGSTKLTQAEIEGIYGTPAVFQSLNYPNTNKQLIQEEGAHWTMMTYFDSTKLPIIAHGIDLMEQGVITGKSNL